MSIDPMEHEAIHGGAARCARARARRAGGRSTRQGRPSPAFPALAFRALAFLAVASLAALVAGCAAGRGPVDEPLEGTEAPRLVLDGETAPDEAPSSVPVAPATAPVAPASTSAAAYSSALGLARERYVIQPGDQLEIRFLFHPYFNTTAPVRPDGRISLQLLQDVPAAGLTPAQLQYYLTKKYESRLDRVELYVAVKSFADPTKGNRVYVGGEVLLPKTVPLEGGMTTLHALYETGGFKDTADARSVLVLRGLHTATPTIYQVDLEAVLEGRGSDLALADRDVVYVPKTFIAEANVFVEQYLNRIVPRWIISSFSFVYPLKATETQSTIDVNGLENLGVTQVP